MITNHFTGILDGLFLHMGVDTCASIQFVSENKIDFWWDIRPTQVREEANGSAHWITELVVSIEMGKLRWRVYTEEGKRFPIKLDHGWRIEDILPSAGLPALVSFGGRTDEQVTNHIEASLSQIRGPLLKFAD